MLLWCFHPPSDLSLTPTERFIDVESEIKLSMVSKKQAVYSLVCFQDGLRQRMKSNPTSSCPIWAMCWPDAMATTI